jgi:hypothetical protein
MPETVCKSFVVLYVVAHNFIGDAAPAFGLQAFELPDTKATRTCCQCSTGVPGVKRSNHIGRHVLENKRGVVVDVPPGGQKVRPYLPLSYFRSMLTILLQLLTDDPCGFCGRSPACLITIHVKSRTIHVNSDCPDRHECKYGSANSSSIANPSTNVPIVCTLCPPDRTRPQQPAIWKYNMDYHLRTRHSGFVIPGWPALTGTHGATADTPGRRLPSDMTELLRLHDEEEDWLGLAVSTPWNAVGTAEPAAVPVNTSLPTTRRGSPPAC